MIAYVLHFSGSNHGPVRERPQGPAGQRGDPLRSLHGLRARPQLQEAAADRHEATQAAAQQEPLLLLGRHEYCHAGEL